MQPSEVWQGIMEGTTHCRTSLYGSGWQWKEATKTAMAVVKQHGQQVVKSADVFGEWVAAAAQTSAWQVMHTGTVLQTWANMFDGW
jgi:hypothetical protein